METKLTDLNRHFTELIKKYPDLTSNIPSIEEAFFLLKSCYEQKGKVLLCGNGGSASDCEHIVGELMKGFLLKRPVSDAFQQKLSEFSPKEADYLLENLQGALPAISLVSQTALMTAFSNDVASDLIFAQQVYGYGNSGDVLIGISTSGNSKNVLYALKVAKAKGLKTVGLTGKTGGMMEEVCDVVIKVPWSETVAIQERHLPIYHCLCIMLEEEFFGK